jgi:NADPH:quinone reductase-like Zn-dependent oxidoreductase
VGKMRAVQVSEPGGEFELVERDIPQPGAGEVLVRVHACGSCHSDSLAKEGGFPGHPLVPGHEIAGVTETVGEGSSTGSRKDASGWTGSAATAATASPVGGATSSAVRTWAFPASPSMAATPTTPSSQLQLWRPCPMS